MHKNCEQCPPQMVLDKIESELMNNKIRLSIVLLEAIHFQEWQFIKLEPFFTQQTAE